MPKKTERGAEATSQINDTKPKKITQEDLILAHMREHGSITSMTAFEKYQITRLAVGIHSLRKKGYSIDTLDEVSSTGKHYGRYVLREEDIA